MDYYGHDLLRFILKILEEKDVPLEKIIIQIAVFFLKATGSIIPYRFELFHNGPYSFEVSSDLDDLRFFKEIQPETNTRFKINKLKETTFLGKEKDRIKKKINTFLDLIEYQNGFDFDKVELVGTVTYCCKAIKSCGESLNEEGVIKEVKAWKGDKYKKSEILPIFHQIKDLITE